MIAMAGMEARTEERTKNFKRDQPIDCRKWLEFEIVETTYRYFRIRFVVEVDATASKSVKSRRVRHLP